MPCCALQLSSGRPGGAASRAARPCGQNGKLLGWVELWGVGELDGRAHEVRLARLPLSVERLQALSGNVTLPAGFRPARLRVLLAPRDQPALPIEFAWQELLAAESPLPVETSPP
jgi:hypothetical protein